MTSAAKAVTNLNVVTKANPQLDVVISAYRETRATELLSALSRLHEVVPLRERPTACQPVHRRHDRGASPR